MQETLKTTLLEFEKSAYLIEMIKEDNELIYIQILQTLFRDKNYQQVIKINPNVFAEIISTLEEFKEYIPLKQLEKFRFLPDHEKDKIQERYLKGVSITDLAMQFDLNKEDVEAVLRNRNIPIVSNDLPVRLKRKSWRKR